MNRGHFWWSQYYSVTVSHRLCQKSDWDCQSRCSGLPLWLLPGSASARGKPREAVGACQVNLVDQWPRLVTLIIPVETWVNLKQRWQAAAAAVLRLIAVPILHASDSDGCDSTVIPSNLDLSFGPDVAVQVLCNWLCFVGMSSWVQGSSMPAAAAAGPTNSANW